MQSYARLSSFAILAIVLLRVGIGWHFYMEGVTKVRSGDFSSEGFLKAAEGPLAPQFHRLIWDYDGTVRLDRNGLKKRFTESAMQAKEHFQLTDQQSNAMTKLSQSFHEKIDEVFAEGHDDVEKYWISVERLKTVTKQDIYHEVSSLNGQMRKVSKDSRDAVADTLKAVDGIWNQYERRLNGIATREQFAAAGPFRFKRPGESLLSTRVVDQIIPIFDMAVGILLIIGLLTPVAAALGAGFLASIVLTQMPGYPGSAPTYNQAVECLAMVALVFTDAGRYAGLDFIPWAWWQRRKAAKEAAIQNAK